MQEAPKPLPQTPLRRRDRAIPEAEARALLANAEWGTLGTVTAGGAPYVTPLSFVLVENNLYFHAALSGHKLDNIAAEPRVCFNVVTGTKPVIDHGFTTRYESATVFGHACLVADDAEKRRALVALCEKYFPGDTANREAELATSFNHTAVVRIDIQSITGKANRG